ncbi:SAF domain-containing protein [Ornithinimicrobium sp. F0845]|nr:SAF domain-containing protein [Ornithinimicrobium sp. F0845]MCK0113537.1 SAF domain-containing protein [Ornithinimicrobium sp. F0845]
MVIIGALAAVWVYLSNSEAIEALAVRETVMRGEVIGAGDLVMVRVNPDPALQLVAGNEIEGFVGQRAARDLSAGSLLTREAVTAEVVPGQGSSVVGLALTPALMPGQPLQVGDSVRIVATPGQAGDPAAFEAAGTLFPAEVVAVSTPPVEFATETVVSVLVPEGRAADLAQWASAGRVALVLDSREGD